MNNSFCPLPWIHLSSLPDGSTRLCCKAVDNRIVDDNGNKMNLGEDTIDNIWNSKYYQQIRRDMVENKFPEACQVCYKEDAVGKRSMRVKELEIWNNSNTLNTALDNTNDGIVSVLPTYLDLRMGNLCNLKCRTCDPVSSSQIHKEGKSITDAPNFFKSSMSTADTMVQWWSTITFKQSLQRLLPTTELVWLSGGEPTLVDEGHALIQRLIDTDRAKDTKLRYVINLTNLTEKFINQFEQFKSVDFHCSIDGINDVNYYMRYPSDFGTLEKNLSRLTETNANLICLIHTVSNLNIYRVPDVIDWLEDFNKDKSNKVKLNLNPVNKPDLFHPSILDDHTKQIVYNKLTNYKTNQKNTKELQSLCNIMMQENTHKNYLQKSFYKYITAVDKLRGQNILDYLPELDVFLGVCKNG